MNINQCPSCHGFLHYDFKNGKKQCGNCGKMWSFELDVKNKKLIVREWKTIELKENEK